MELIKVVITSEKICCEKCRSNVVEIIHDEDVYTGGICPICHSKINGIKDDTHFWKMGERINQIIKELGKERFE
jgi:hypothetical protein